MSEYTSMASQTTYPEQVAAYVRNNIRNGELRPGDVIKESMLATRLHVSRAPVREALQILTREDLVTSTPQHSKIVCILTPDEILDAFRFCGILEAAGAIDGLGSWTEADTNELAAILADLQRMQKTPTLEKFFKVHEFHRKIISRCGNELLRRRTHRACERITSYLYHGAWLGLLSTVNFYAAYNPLVEAMRSRDPDTITRRIRKCFEDFGSHMAMFGTEPEHRQPVRRRGGAPTA